MHCETASITLIGHRSSNQDRARIIESGGTVLVIVADGMGGHAEGEKAAIAAVDTVARVFDEAPKPVFDPRGFLRLAINEAHDAAVALGNALPMDSRPRATVAIALIQDNKTWWGHVGDSRIYHLRASRVVDRTRDHSHVEVLRREGLISEQEMHTHPLRNFVEHCLGGDPELGGMAVSTEHLLQPDDMILVCSDGLWSGASEAQIAATQERSVTSGDEALAPRLTRLAESAVAACAPNSDNTTAAVAIWRGP